MGLTNKLGKCQVKKKHSANLGRFTQINFLLQNNEIWLAFEVTVCLKKKSLKIELSATLNWILSYV